MSPDDFIEEYEAALASRKWVNVERLLHQDICVTFSTGTFRGKSEVQRAFEGNFTKIEDEEYSISNLFWVYRSNDSAVCIYEFSWKGLINCREKSGCGRGTSVLAKVGAQWQLVTEHLGPKAS